MKVAIDNRAAVHSGIGNYSTILLNLLPKADNDIKTIAYEDNIAFDRDNVWNKYINGLKRLFNDQVMFNSWAREKQIDVFHNPRNTGVPIFKNCKVVVTIHDVIPHVFPQYYLSNIIERIYYEIMIRLSIHCSDKIITISEFSKQELIKYYGVTPEKIIVTPLACSDKFRVVPKEQVTAVNKKYGIHRQYLLTIGGSEYRKNVRTVLEAYDAELARHYDLIVIGGKWRGYDLETEFKNKEGIKFLKGISDEDLIALYNGAQVFIYASLYEGFGIPLLEAMNCGTPVIAAKASCLPEVAGDSALYFDTKNNADLRKKINNLLTDQDQRQKMIKAGFEQAKLYSWEKTVKQTAEVYKQIL